MISTCFPVLELAGEMQLECSPFVMGPIGLPVECAQL
jgi:hypothetical protein